MTKQIKDSEFDAEVLNSEIPVLVDFWAGWCKPCQILEPVLEQLSEEMNNIVKIVKVNVQENPIISSKYEIRSIPTLILFNNKKVVDKKIGVLTKNVIKDWIEGELKK